MYLSLFLEVTGTDVGPTRPWKVHCSDIGTGYGKLVLWVSRQERERRKGGQDGGRIPVAAKSPAKDEREAREI